MYAPRPFEIVRRQRAVERVVRVCGYKNFSAVNPYDNGRMVEVARRPAELHDVADFQFVKRSFFRERSRALGIVYQKVIEIFDARPGGRSLVYRSIVPAEGGGIIHNLRPSIDAL